MSTRSPRRIPWTEVCKFLSGAFFVSAGILFYLHLTQTPVPLLGTSIVVQPAAHGVRSLVHTALFVVCLYFGYIRPSQGAKSRSA